VARILAALAEHRRIGVVAAGIRSALTDEFLARVSRGGRSATRQLDWWRSATIPRWHRTAELVGCRIKRATAGWFAIWPGTASRAGVGGYVVLLDGADARARFGERRGSTLRYGRSTLAWDEGEASAQRRLVASLIAGFSGRRAAAEGFRMHDDRNHVEQFEVVWPPE